MGTSRRKTHWCLFCEVPEIAHNILKYCLFGYNVFFLFLAMGMIGLGVWAQAMKSEYEAMSTVLANPAIFIIVIGCLLWLMTFTGCLGALRENIWLLKFYAFAMLVGVILQVIFGILCIAFKSKATTALGNAFDSAIEDYYDDIDLQNVMDYMQETFECCGGNSYTDWRNNEYFTCTAPGPSACGVPYSCCDSSSWTTDVVNTQCGYGLDEDAELLDLVDKIYINGCSDRFVVWLEDNLNILAGVILGLLLPQFAGVFMSFLFASQVQDEIDDYNDSPDSALPGISAESQL